jgi:protein arginine kinase activator
MNCENCDNPATIHLTQVVEGEVKKLHLCEACAAAEGVDTHKPQSVSDILLNMGSEPVKPIMGAAVPDVSCPRCFMGRSDFKKTGRLGCPECYRIFSDELHTLVKAMHHSNQHRGKVPVRESARVRAKVTCADIESRLEKAIASENFEEAATLRDELEASRGILES